MNCKQGDLAIIVKSAAGNEGKIVRCIKFLGIKRKRYLDCIKEQECWEIDVMFKSVFGGYNNIFPDEWMRPIRDSDKEDEMLRIVGKPEKETC